jgi:hypothetical protein
MVPFKRRYNFKKAKWSEYAVALDRVIKTFQPTLEHYDDFVKIIKKISKQYISRGCRQNYVPGMKKQLQKTFDEFTVRYENNPFDDETIQIRDPFDKYFEGKKERMAENSRRNKYGTK